MLSRGPPSRWMGVCTYLDTGASDLAYTDCVGAALFAPPTLLAGCAYAFSDLAPSAREGTTLLTA